MPRVLASTLVALEFLTPLRVRRVEVWDDRTFGVAAGWFPLIGLGLGGVLLALDGVLGRLLPPGATGALLLAALALLTGGIHLDGVADTADGLAVQGDRATRLGVMSEGTTGAAGVMALALVVLVQWTAISALAPPYRAGALLLAPALGRWAVTPVAMIFPPARPRGLGHALHQGNWAIAGPIAAMLSFGAAAVLFGPGGLLLPLAAGLGGVVLAAAAARMLGGVTGDTFGAAIEVSQTVVLLFLVACAQRGWLTPSLFT